MSTTMAVSWYLRQEMSGSAEENSLFKVDLRAPPRVPAHRLHHPGSMAEQGNGLIHQRVGLHEVQHLIGQRGGRAESGSLHRTAPGSAGRDGGGGQVSRERRDGRARGVLWLLRDLEYLLNSHESSV